MKRIEKGCSPQAFEDWKASSNDDWQPTYENLQHPQKSALHRSLLAEQGCLCCYCGRRIDATDSHIEHFRPQERYPDRALQFENLHASCIRETQPGTPIHCGHAKGSNFDEISAISPLDAQCEQRFRYTRHGQVSACDARDHCVDYMIDLLHLNHTALAARRRAALDGVFDFDLTDQELDRIKSFYVTRDGQGLFPDFGQVVSCYAMQLCGSKR